MKNNMKKLIISLIALVFLFTGSKEAFASVTWNTDTKDCKGIAIALQRKDNTYINSKDSYGCWMLPVVEQEDSDGQVSVNIFTYYHNTGNETAQDVKIKISVSPAIGQSSQTHTFTGTIYYTLGTTQYSQNLGSVKVLLSESQPLSYGISRHYLDRENSSYVSDISSKYITEYGTEIGDIAPGWDYQSVIISTFRTPEDTNDDDEEEDDNNGGCEISSFRAYPDEITLNNYQSNIPVILSWISENATSFNIPGVGSWNDVPENRLMQTEVYPIRDTTYTLYAYGDSCDGSDEMELEIEVNQNYYDDDITPSVSTYSPSYIGTTSATMSGYVNNNYSSYYNDYDDSLIDAWFEFPCGGSRYGYQSDLSSANMSYSISNLSSNTTYSYCAVARNQEGQTFKGNTITFTTAGSTNPQPTDFSVWTTVPLNVTNSSAVLNGIVTNRNSSTNTYFEYGTTVSLGSRTSSRTTGSGTNVSFSETISGLSPNTSYFYRAVGEKNGAVSRGLIDTFRTLGSGSKPIIVQGTTVASAESPIMLEIENKYQSIRVGDIIDYTVTYKNIGSKKLTKPMVQVVLPTGIDFVNSSNGTYDLPTKTLSAPVDDLESQDEGVIYLQAKVSSLVQNNYQIITTAILVYTNPNKSQENAIAYVINNPNYDNSLLGASAIFAGLSLNGWLTILLLIVIALLAFLIARTYRRRNYGYSQYPSYPPYPPENLP